MMTSSVSSPAWLAEGFAHIWLPYSSMQPAHMPLPVTSAEGLVLHLEDGRQLVDGISSWWTMCHGYQHPALIKAMETQLHQLSHVMMAGLAHAPTYELASKLCAIAPEGLTRVFFSDSGSVAVEVAMKMAVQYWRNHGDKNRTKFLCFHQGYHGDTMGAMSLSDPEHGMHRMYQPYLPKQYVWTIPRDEISFAEFDSLLHDIRKTTAAVIIEPLMQCAGGMHYHSPDILAEIHRLCRKNDLLLIADEIATGFGRTGHFFACQEAGITPDIMCVGKALTGGMIPMAATLATSQVFDAFTQDHHPDKTLMHGPTFMGNPLAASAALASLALLTQPGYLHRITQIEEQLRQELSPCKRISQVQEVRICGAIGAIDVGTPFSENSLAQLREYAIQQGAWLRPFGQVIYTMPAFIATEEEISTLCRVMREMVGLL